MVREYLADWEAIISVVRPNGEKNKEWFLPIITLFSHHDGVTLYNGVLAVTATSRVITEEQEKDWLTGKLRWNARGRLSYWAYTIPIRIDARRLDEFPGSMLGLFDVKMKPMSCVGIEKSAVDVFSKIITT
ncbi:hypothetical protein LZ31DRAFT_328179 [Colletotrichum somersetense]|nr:hypothetical protein LZ31DRAFT_328179 [Colletotrichum somersetense]